MLCFIIVRCWLRHRLLHDRGLRLDSWFSRRLRLESRWTRSCLGQWWLLDHRSECSAGRRRLQRAGDGRFLVWKFSRNRSHWNCSRRWNDSDRLSSTTGLDALVRDRLHRRLEALGSSQFTGHIYGRLTSAKARLNKRLAPPSVWRLCSSGSGCCELEVREHFGVDFWKMNTELLSVSTASLHKIFNSPVSGFFAIGCCCSDSADLSLTELKSNKPATGFLPFDGFGIFESISNDSGSFRTFLLGLDHGNLNILIAASNPLYNFEFVR